MRPGLPSCLLSMALLGLGGWVWVLHRQLHEQETRLATSASALALAHQRADAAEARLAALPPPSLSAPVAVSDATPAAAGPARPPVPGSPTVVFDDATMQTLMAAAARGSLDRRYAPLFRKLQLDPARTERLKDLLTERQMSSFDVVRAAQAEGLGNAEINALLAKSGSEIDANIRLLLGQPGYEQFQDQERNGGAYGLLDDMERRLGFNHAPLSETQSAEVLRIIAETTGSATPAGLAEDPMFRIMQGMGGGPPMMNVLSQPLITDQTLETARPLLNESQIEVLRQLQTEQQAQLDAIRSMGGPFRP